MPPLPSPPVGTRPLGPAFPPFTARPGVPAVQGSPSPPARRGVGGRWRPASGCYGERRLPLYSGGRETGCDVRPRPRPEPALPLASLSRRQAVGPGGAEGRSRPALRPDPRRSRGHPFSPGGVACSPAWGRGCPGGRGVSHSSRAAAGLLRRKTNLCRLPASSAGRRGAPSSGLLRWDAFVGRPRRESYPLHSLALEALVRRLGTLMTRGRVGKEPR